MPSRVLSSLVSCVLMLSTPTLAFPGYDAPQTSFGVPDLTGIWTVQTATPLERSLNYKDLIATPAELAARRERQRAARATVVAPPPDGSGANDLGDVGQEQSEFGDENNELTVVSGERRTSIITSPSDGRLPYTAAGRRQVEVTRRNDPHEFDGPEHRSASERCLASPNGQAGPPMLSGPDNAKIEIIQTRDNVAILSEMIHDLRTARVAGAHAAIRLHPILGDGVAHYEGDTLVIETVDQSPLTTVRENGASLLLIPPTAKVTERLRRISENEIDYQFTVEDTSFYSQPWIGELILRRSAKPIFEYACHEGNYALANILSGAREQEKKGSFSRATDPR